MNKYILTACMLWGATSVQADMFKHDLQVFTANTMEIPCGGAPKELFFGKYEEVVKMSNEEIKNIVNNGVSQVGSNVGSWFGASGIDAGSLGANLGAGMIGTYLGTALKNAVYDAINDPEYLLISECNTGKNYTRLITMVVSNNELDLITAKQLAQQDQRKMARKVNR